MDFTDYKQVEQTRPDCCRWCQPSCRLTAWWISHLMCVTHSFCTPDRHAGRERSRPTCHISEANRLMVIKRWNDQMWLKHDWLLYSVGSFSLIVLMKGRSAQLQTRTAVFWWHWMLNEYCFGNYNMGSDMKCLNFRLNFVCFSDEREKEPVHYANTVNLPCIKPWIFVLFYTGVPFFCHNALHFSNKMWTYFVCLCCIFLFLKHSI